MAANIPSRLSIQSTRLITLPMSAWYCVSSAGESAARSISPRRLEPKE
jgi:hypothetical protein